MKKIYHILVSFFFIFLFISAFLIAILQTKWAKEKIKNFVITYIQKKEMPIKIGSIEGEFFHTFKIKNLEVFLLDKKILIKDNKAVGCKIGDKDFQFDIIISNILVQNLFKISDEKLFPEKYVTELKSLKGTGSLCAYYSLKKIPDNLIGKTFHFLERNIGVDGNDAVGMIDLMTTSADAGLSPEGEYLVQSYIICTPDEAKNPMVLKKLRQLLDKNLKTLIPDYADQLNWAFYPSIWHLDGVAKTIEKDKPDIKTPIKNLYLVGDCVKAPGIGFNCAINSARILTDYLEKNEN